MKGKEEAELHHRDQRRHNIETAREMGVDDQNRIFGFDAVSNKTCSLLPFIHPPTIQRYTSSPPIPCAGTAYLCLHFGVFHHNEKRLRAGAWCCLLASPHLHWCVPHSVYVASRSPLCQSNITTYLSLKQRIPASRSRCRVVQEHSNATMRRARLTSSSTTTASP